METMTIEGMHLKIEWEYQRNGMWIAIIETPKSTVTIAGPSKEDIIEQFKQRIKTSFLI